MATHLDQSNYLANQQQVLGFAVPFTSLSKLCQIAGPKPFCCTKPTCFDFSSSNFNLQGDIMCTGGVALRGGRVLRTKCPPTSYNQLCEIHFEHWTRFIFGILADASEEGGSSSSRKKGRCLQLVKSMISHADQIAQFQLPLIICLGFTV
jgi:hypothetical protein